MSNEPITDKTATAYLAGEIGPQDILHDMGILERELAAEKKLSAACSRDCNNTALERNAALDALAAEQSKVKELREALDTLMTEVECFDDFSLSRDCAPHEAQECWDYAVDKAQTVLLKTKAKS